MRHVLTLTALPSLVESGEEQDGEEEEQDDEEDGEEADAVCSRAARFPRDFTHPSLRVYPDPQAAPAGLRRGITLSEPELSRSFIGPVLRIVCGGHIRSDQDLLTTTQAKYTLAIPGTGYQLS